MLWVVLKWSLSTWACLNILPQTTQGGLFSKWTECVISKCRLALDGFDNTLPQIKHWLPDMLVESAINYSKSINQLKTLTEKTRWLFMSLFNNFLLREYLGHIIFRIELGKCYVFFSNVAWVFQYSWTSCRKPYRVGFYPNDLNASYQHAVLLWLDLITPCHRSNIDYQICYWNLQSIT